MAQLGGGAEAHANSSLVLTTDSHTHEPTGEPVSLHGNGRIDPRTFGDRAYRGELDDKLTKSDPGQAGNVRQSKKRRLQEESVLTSTEPKTQEEAMLSVIQQFLGRQPLNIDDSGAADELLAMLKNQVAEDEAVVFSVWNGEADHTPSILQAPQEVDECVDEYGGGGLQEESVLTSTEEGVYQPKTQEEAMLSVIQQFLGRQPLNVDDSGAADELLAMLKNQVAEDEVVVFSVWNGEADEVVEHGSGWYDGWYEYDGFSLSHHTPSILQAPQEVGGCM